MREQAWTVIFAVVLVISVGWLIFVTTPDGAPVRPEWVELDRATQGTVLVRPSAVDAILGPGEVVLDDGAGTRHNAHTQVVVGLLRINVRGTAAQVHEALD